jgi:hypothetical protein
LYKRQTVFLQDKLTAVEKRKKYIKYDKPCYIGFTILELSKLQMYKEFYEVIKPLWPRPIKFDTDGMCIYVETEHAYVDMRKIQDNLNVFEYPMNHTLFEGMNEKETKGWVNKNKKALGKLKYDNNGIVVREIIAMRSKQYAESKNDGKSKGTNKATIKKQLKFENFKEQLFNKDAEPLYKTMYRIGVGRGEQENYVTRVNKKVRFICKDRITTLPHGFESILDRLPEHIQKKVRDSA